MCSGKLILACSLVFTKKVTHDSFIWSSELLELLCPSVGTDGSPGRDVSNPIWDSFFHFSQINRPVMEHVPEGLGQVEGDMVFKCHDSASHGRI